MLVEERIYRKQTYQSRRSLDFQRRGKDAESAHGVTVD